MTTIFERVAAGVKEVGLDIKKGINEVADFVKGGSSVEKAASEYVGHPMGGKALRNSPITKFPAVDGNPTPVRLSTTTPQQAKVNKPKYSSYTFPFELENFMQLNFKMYDAAGVFALRTVMPTTTISLPLPANLQEQFSATWDEISFGAFGGTALNTSADVLRNFMDGKGAGSAGDILKNALGNSQAGYGAATVAGTAALDKLFQEFGKAQPGTGSAVAGRLTGVTPNPHLGVVFRNMSLREHQFAYRLAAANEWELQAIQNIVYELKKWMLPGKGGSSFILEYPGICSISFQPDPKKPYIIKDCVLIGLTFNYASEGVAMFRTGDPVMVELSLQFKELSMFTREDNIHQGTNPDAMKDENWYI